MSLTSSKTTKTITYNWILWTPKIFINTISLSSLTLSSYFLGHWLWLKAELSRNLHAKNCALHILRSGHLFRKKLKNSGRTRINPLVWFKAGFVFCLSSNSFYSSARSSLHRYLLSQYSVSVSPSRWIFIQNKWSGFEEAESKHE